MSQVKIQGNASGTGIFTVAAPNSNTDRTLTLPDTTGTVVATDASGNVGIGTSSPSQKLTVSANSNDVMSVISTGDTNADLYLKATGTTLGNVRLRANANDMVFITGLAERMRIDSSGRVTKPYQPAFRATRSTGTSVSSGSTVPYDSEDFDTGSNYNTSTYRFTAPVSGKYAFQWTARNTSSGAAIYVRLRKNGSDIGPALEAGTTGTVHATCSTVLSLSANDYVEAVSGSSGTQVDSSDGFSGYLIG